MTPQLFKQENNAKAEEFKRFLPVNVTLSFRSIAPAIALCERKYLLPLLGEALFDRLAAYYNDGCDNGVLQALLELCQFALIRLAFWQEYDILSVSLGDKGASDNAGENRLYRYQSEALKANLKNEGFDQLDAILEYCEKQIDEMEEFRESPCHIASGNSLVRNTREFNEIYNINNSRLVFLKMRYYIAAVEDLEARHHLGDAFYNELLVADHAQDKYKRIIPNLKKFLVFHSIHEGIAELHQLPTEKGLIFQSAISNRVSEEQYAPVPAKEMERTRADYKRKAERYMAAVIDTLKQYPDDYPAYFSFAGANAPQSKNIRRDNTNKKIFLA
ncbi:hypothetical protein LJC68_07355 [Bacteroidales bacterium OttesenSCG-928-B11]|nr:hypothetical protein [Bacteroidales bacterium OttesenSCG-928-B11]MDL2326892.1 hypothetical protein [Bacteroidales bacterium OttesenSCG-928-A14]